MTFLVGEGDFEREAEGVSGGQETRVEFDEGETDMTNDWGRRRIGDTDGGEWINDLPGATTGEATAAILKLIYGLMILLTVELFCQTVD